MIGKEVRFDVAEADPSVLIDAVRLSAICANAVATSGAVIKKMGYEVLDRPGVSLFVIFDKGHLSCATMAPEGVLLLNVLTFEDVVDSLAIADDISQSISGRVVSCEISDRSSKGREMGW